MKKKPRLGNKNGIKLKNPDYRQEAYRQYCEYISKGNSKEGWKFVHPVDILKSLCYKTMERYMRENPLEFPPILMDMAQCDSFKVFEEDGKRLMKGQYRNGSPEVWKTFMRNKFKWDKDIMEKAEKCSADKILEGIRALSEDKVAHYKKVKSK